MNKRISKIDNDVQDRNSVAWKKLCDYIDQIAENGNDEFSPREFLGEKHFFEIYTLPESIAKLKAVKKIWLYGSKLKRIPPEIGQMKSLEYFDPYTSYDLHWFPYEITRCKHLKDSRISTRALYGNYKNRMGFPRLDHNPVRYHGNTVYCSMCNKKMTYEETNQFWITLGIATDIVPLLVNLCSQTCQDALPKPAKNYVQFPHKGGSNVAQPPDEDEMWKLKMQKREQEKHIAQHNSEISKETDTTVIKKPVKLFKVIRKIWEK